MSSWAELIALIILVACVLWLPLGPLNAIRCLLSSYRDQRSLHRFCEAIDAWDSTRQRPKAKEVGDAFITLKLLSFNQSSKENRELLATLYSEGNPPLEDLQLPNISTKRGSILALFAQCELPVSFALSAESIADALAKGSGLSKEHQTGDAAFDRKVYISCESSQFIRQYLTAPRRQLLLSLLEKDFQQVLYLRSSNRFILCSSAGYLRKPADPEQAIKNLLALLPQDNERFSAVALPQKSPHSAPSRTAAPPSTHHLLKEVLGILAIGAIAWGGGGSYARQTVSGQDQFSIICSLSLLVIAALSLRVMRQVKGRSYAHRAVLSAVAAYSISVPVACWLLVQNGNSLLDFRGEYSERGVFVGTTTHVRRSRLSLSRAWHQYSVAIFRLSGEQGAAPSVEISVDEARLDELKGRKDTPATVMLKPGLFGIAYGVGFSLDE